METLRLQIGLENWPLFVRRRKDKAFWPIRDRVFARDQHVCQFCGFQANEYQEVVNRDNDYRNNKLDNLMTACCFCIQSLFFAKVGQEGFGGGKVIYLPEMTPGELNGFCHVIFCAMQNGTHYQNTAESIYRSLKFRAQCVEEPLGANTSNPSVLGHMLIEYQGKNARAADNLLKDLRILPLYPKFKKQLSAWANTAIKELAKTG